MRQNSFGKKIRTKIWFLNFVNIVLAFDIDNSLKSSLFELRLVPSCLLVNLHEPVGLIRFSDCQEYIVVIGIILNFNVKDLTVDDIWSMVQNCFYFLGCIIF